MKTQTSIKNAHKGLMLVLALAFFSNNLLAQTNIKGIVTDTASKPLEGATVMLMTQKDSSLVNFSRSATNGSFEFKGIAKDAYFLKITYVGLQNYDKLLPNQLSAGEFDLGKISLQAINKELDGVTVKGDKIPVEVKLDTIVYNADAFKTKPNANVEDLLKRLPGVQVDAQGNIKAQGEEVKRVMVNGKDFFGGRDPKMATRNLPKEAVEKVQMIDRKTDQAIFSGVDDGNREKTLNIELKDKYKEGVFGNLMAGAGTESRFDSKLNLNQFKKTTQLSVIGQGNNTNEQGFSIQEYLQFSGELSRMMGGGRNVRIELDGNNLPMPINFGQRNAGFMKSWAGGVHFNKEFSKKTELNGSYFYNSLNTIAQRDIVRQNFLENQAVVNQRQSSDGRNQNESHRFNTMLDHKIDSLNTIRWSNTFTKSQTSVFSDNINENFTQDRKQNDGKRINSTLGDNTNLNGSVLWRHRFSKKGRNMTANLTYGYQSNDQNGTLEATNNFYYKTRRGTDSTATEKINQRNFQNTQRFNYGLNLTHTEPVGKRKYIDFLYNFNQNNINSDRQVFDVVPSERPNPNLSVKFENQFVYHRGGSSFRYNSKKANWSVGIEVQSSNLDAKVLSNSQSISRSFVNVLPHARLQYDMGGGKTIRLNYQTSVQEPSINDLLPVAINNDPLNQTVGNANLRPEYAHRGTLSYNVFNMVTMTSLFSNIRVNYTTDKFSQSQNISSDLRRVTQTINTPNDLSIDANVSGGFKIKPIKTQINLGTGFTYQNGINVVNNKENTTIRNVYELSASADYQLENFNLSGGVEWNKNVVDYSLQPTQNQSFNNITYKAESNVTFLKTWTLATTYNYYVYEGRSTDLNQGFGIWNMSLSKFIFKLNRGEIKLSATDLLNQNVSINRTATANFIQEDRTRTLGRFFLLTFRYNLGINPGGGTGKGMRRTMIRG
jgi:hypothetical protein